MFRKLLALSFCSACLALCVYFRAESAVPENEPVAIKLKLIDAETGEAIPGIVRAFRAGEEKSLPLLALRRHRGRDQEAYPRAIEEVIVPRTSPSPA